MGPENSRSSSVPVAWKTSSSTTTTTPIPNQNVMSKLWILLALVAAAVALPAQPDREAKDMKDLTDFRRAWTVSRNAIAAKVEQAMQPAGVARGPLDQDQG